MKPLFIPLKGEFYDQFAKGQKDTEYRPYGPRWNERTCPVGREVVLSRGYGKAHRLRGTVAHFTRSKVITQTGLWRSIYGTNHQYAACVQIRLAVSITGCRACKNSPGWIQTGTPGERIPCDCGINNT